MSAPSLRVVVAAVLALTAGSCDSGPTAPIAGEVEFMIVSPNGPEGAALIELRTTEVGLVTSSGARVFTGGTGDNTRILLVRTNPGTLSFRLTVNDVRRPAAASLLEIAGGDNQLRELSGYRIETKAVTQP